MLKNYIKIALRNLLKNKLFSVINIFGMALSLACFFIISIFLWDELKYDQHVKDADNKYRVYIEYYRNGAYDKDQAGIPSAFGKSLQESYPEVEYSTRILNVIASRLLTYEKTSFLQPDGVFAEQSIFDLLNINTVAGDVSTALIKPATIALSQSLSHKLFKEEDPIGKIVNIDGQDFEVTAIYEDFPYHSHLNFSYLLSFRTLYDYSSIQRRMDNWTWQQFLTYIKLKDGADADELMNKFLGEVKEKAWPLLQETNSYYIPKAMPIKDVHLYATNQVHDMAVKGNAQTIYILAGAALFILVIACLNFINLSTARAVGRMKEVGLRKVIGANKKQLILQFIGESVIVTLLALVIAGIATELAIPSLNTLTGKNINAGIFLNPEILIVLVFFAIIIGIAAGAYPAYHIAAFSPNDILSSHKNPKGGKALFRKALVTIQFMLTFFLITGSIIVSQQNNYLFNKDLGFDHNNVVAVSSYGQVDEEVLKQRFLNIPGVTNATAGYGLPGEAYATDGIKDLETGQDHVATVFTVDHDYIKTLQGEIIAGRDFDVNRPSDMSAFIVNEQVLKMLNLSSPEEALGKKLSWTLWENQDSAKVGEIIGVAKDMHIASLKEHVIPMIIHVYPFAYNTVTVRLKPEEVQQAIAAMEEEWNSHGSNYPFSYRFLNDNFDRMYKQEARLNVLFRFFTVFTIIVASLGLLGLVVYSLTQKMKEVGIRKVLGASIPSLIIYLSKGYVKLLLISFVLAVPFSYYAASKWLENFIYKIEITPKLFLYGGMIIFAITLLTVLVQSLKTALLNPVDVIKDE